MLEDLISQNIRGQRRVTAGIIGDGYGRNPAVGKGIFGNLFKSLGICVLIYFVAIFLGRVLPLTTRFELVLKVAIIGFVSFAIFYLLGLLLKLSYISEATQNLCKRLRRK